MKREENYDKHQRIRSLFIISCYEINFIINYYFSLSPHNFDFQHKVKLIENH